MAKVSIIIPVYNVEKYLRECMNSVVNQTLKDIEIICIDDGSTDNSGKILDEYAKDDSRIKVIHKENCGLGSARNEGLKYVNAEYIFFLDSDDFIKLETLEKMYNKSKLLDLDICVCGGTKYNTETAQHQVINNSIDKKYLPKTDVFKSFDVKDTIFHLFVGWVWDKLYKTSLIMDNNLKFPDFKNTEDTYFVYMALILSNRISIIDESLHTYRQNVANSVSATRESEPDAFIKAMNLIKENLKSRNLYENFRTGYLNYFITFSKWHLDTISCNHKEDLYKKIKNFINLNINKNEKLFFIDNYIADLYARYNRCSTYQKFETIDKNKNTDSFIENIFSIKNSKDNTHKIITILGLRIKFKRNRAD